MHVSRYLRQVSLFILSVTLKFSCESVSFTTFHKSSSSKSEDRVAEFPPLTYSVLLSEIRKTHLDISFLTSSAEYQ